MTYKLVRIDGKEDNITKKVFIDFDSAYDFLEKVYKDICCSDADYGDMNYYDIVDNKSPKGNDKE